MSGRRPSRKLETKAVNKVFFACAKSIAADMSIRNPCSSHRNRCKLGEFVHKLRSGKATTRPRVSIASALSEIDDVVRSEADPPVFARLGDRTRMSVRIVMEDWLGSVVRSDSSDSSVAFIRSSTKQSRKQSVRRIAGARLRSLVKSDRCAEAERCNAELKRSRSSERDDKEQERCDEEPSV